MDIAKFFIVWGPTLLFFIIVGIGILIGCWRGFRKSLILFVHMLAINVVCLILFLCLVNDANFDTNFVSFTNSILNNFNGNSLQNIMNVDENCTSLQQILSENFLNQYDSEKLEYWLILENAAYINTLVDMAFHLIIAVLCFIVYLFLIFIMYLIYLIFYPIRRRIQKENRRYHNGEVNHPYRKKRILGACVGGIRSIITAVMIFSFLGSLIYVVSGGNQFPNRDNLKEDEKIEFSDPKFNSIYDYYSYICEMGNTGIFNILNGIKDTSQTPFYFYFSDLVLQGKLNDENLGIENEKFYLRDELGEYVRFVNSSLTILLKYSETEEMEAILQGDLDNTELMQILMQTMQKEGFVEEYNSLIDSFEGKPFMNNLCLSSLTSLINHIDLVAPENKEVIGIVNQLFKSEEAIKVNDLATGADIKNLFKGLVSVVASLDLEEETTYTEEMEGKLISTKQSIAIVQKLLPTMQSLSLFTERQDIGNKVIKGLYTYCSNNLISEDMKIEVPENINWINEFNILMRACDPLLSIGYEIYNDDKTILMSNLAYIFEGENSQQMELAFDKLSLELTQSQLLDIVFKSSFVGKALDDLVISIAKNEEASIPKDISYMGNDGECSIFLNSLKLFLKNGGGPVLITMMEQKDNLGAEAILQMLDIFTSEVNIYESKTILDVLLDSKLLYYMVSTYLTYAEFGAFKLYLPNETIEYITEGTGENLRVYKMIKQTEIKTITDLLSNCKELIVELIENPNEIDYATILTNQYIKETIDKSLLLQGTMANIIIGMSTEQNVIVLPELFDQPEQWLSSDAKGEIEILINAVYHMAESDKTLINDLMNGSIKASTLIGLDNSILEMICTSKVLRYTISDMITTLGSNDFEIVVARSSIELLAAKTTTEKTVNVISARELSEIFIDIKTIVDFDEQDQVKVDYNAIFENKAEISKNKTITATLVQMMLKYEESGFLIVPRKYQEDFEKIKTEIVLNNNVWFGTSTGSEDDELFLMLSAIETLIEKDETGKIPDDFDLENLQNNLKIKENEIGTLCTSAILNASISNQIINIFNVPVSIYTDELIEVSELETFFQSIFKLFNRSEIIANELDSNLFDIHFKEEATHEVLASIIMRATISEKMIALEQLYIPQNQGQEISYVNKGDSYLINDLELQKVFQALFALLNQDEIAVNSINQQLNTIALEAVDINILLESEILRATISSNVVDVEELIIPQDVVLTEGLLNAKEGTLIDKLELKLFMNALFVLFETESIEVNHLNTLLQEFSITSNKVESLLASYILQATIANKFLTVENLVIPNNVVKEITTIKSSFQSIIVKEELRSFLQAILVTSDEAISGSNYDLNHLILPTTIEAATIMTTSLIVSATLSSKIITEDSIIIVLDEVLTPYLFQGLYSEEAYIMQEELANLLLALTVGMGISDPMHLSFETIILPTTTLQKQALLNSIILRATISERVLRQEKVSIEVSSANIFTEYHYKNNQVGILSGTEILNIIRGIELLNPEQGNFDNLILDVGDIIAMENKIEVLEAISKSDVYRSIISRTLSEEISFSGMKTQAYQMFLSSQAMATIIIDGNAVSYQYAPALLPGKYVIKYPAFEVDLYTSFELITSFGRVFMAEDILALQHTLQF